MSHTKQAVLVAQIASAHTCALNSIAEARHAAQQKSKNECYSLQLIDSIRVERLLEVFDVPSMGNYKLK